ncbi:MAG TPA: hypothetical protein VK853_09520 [Ilumatobacteraceae bacterium]|nr:hypothetical protein [Ilumatobacteraceae bacterium]
MAPGVAPIVRLGLLVAAVVGVGGCFTTTADYRQEAETFIVDDDTIAGELGVAMVSATCDEPTDQEPGTTFACTAIDADGAEWGFAVEIRDDNRFEVSVSAFP